jgi:hypothetical protein
MEISTTKSKFRIVICELYHDFLHGVDTSSISNGHYLVIDTFHNFYEEEDPEHDDDEEENDNESDTNTEESSDSLLEEDNFEILSLCVDLHREKYRELLLVPRFASSEHKTIRNYMHIIQHPSYIQPQIAYCYLLENNDCVCVIKTYWLRLIQRTWKKIYKQRMDISQRRKSISSLKHREITGKWPDDLRVLPSIYGMLR